jgi:hypothetical protein
VAEKKTAVDWQSFASHPEKLLSQLEYTATKIQQSRHFAEYELALQRTRLKRKERELKTLSEGLSLQMQSADRSPAAEQDKYAPGGRRWMRMLGMGKQESE